MGWVMEKRKVNDLFWTLVGVVLCVSVCKWGSFGKNRGEVRADE